MHLLQLLSIAGLSTLFGYEMAPTMITKVNVNQPFPGSEVAYPTGMVKLSFYENKSVLLEYAVDDDCKPEEGTKNSCGIHIHHGTSCKKSGDVGGHLYYGNDDPWLPIRYVPSKGKAMVDFGGYWEDAIGQVLVLHGPSGAKISCTEIATGTREIDSDMAETEPRGFSNIPGYQGPLKVTGFAHVEFYRNLSVHINFRADGVEGKCHQHDPSIKNSCGIHIHEGYSCDNVGEHFYNKELIMTDPWAHVVYSSTGDYASGKVNVALGYNFEDAVGRTLVLHDYSGQKIACAIIGPDTLMAYVPQVGVPIAPHKSVLQGSATVHFKTNKQIIIEYDLTNVNGCDDGPGTAVNSCGIHIHEGYSCDMIGGHYYRLPYDPSQNNDPWAHATYSATHSVAKGSVTVNIRAPYEQAVNRVLVTHDYYGDKQTCVVIKPDLPALQVPNLGKFPDYGGDTSFPIQGNATVEFHANKTVTISYNMQETDPNCAMPNSVTPNSCGIHIHRGFSCEDAQGHYYEPPVLMDPWTSITYISRNDGSAVGSVNVMFGATADQATGRVLVVHDYKGAKATCVVVGMKAQSVMVAGLGSFPEYQGSGTVAPTGTANLIFHNNKSVTIDFMVQGVEAKCSSPGDAANSCGIHIHSGYSCDDPSHVGGHYFASAHDPWSSIVYTAQGTAATGSVTVDFGFTFYDAIGRVLILHDWNGKKATCVVIGESGTPSAAVAVRQLGMFPGYQGNVSLSGSANLTFYGTRVLIAYDLTNVEAACAFPSTDHINSCGIHIHEGMSCDDANKPGEHYYNSDELKVDPWLVAMYIANGTSAKGTVQVDFGYSAREAKGRVLVLHNWQGDKITCMPFGKDVSIDISAFGKYPDYAGSLDFSGSVKLDFMSTTPGMSTPGMVNVNVHYNISGVENECTNPDSGVEYSCGIHIHRGYSCDNPNDPGVVWGNNWANSKYRIPADAVDGRATGMISVALDKGDSIVNGSGRVFVLHAYNGEKVTCIPFAYEYEPLAACDSPSSAAIKQIIGPNDDVSDVCNEAGSDIELAIFLNGDNGDNFTASKLTVPSQCKAASVRFFASEGVTVHMKLVQDYALPKLLSYCNITFQDGVSIQSTSKKGPRLLLENIVAPTMVIDAYDFVALSKVTVGNGIFTSSKLLRIMDSTVDSLILRSSTPSSSKVEVVGLKSSYVNVKDLNSALLSGNVVDSQSIDVQNVRSVQLANSTFNNQKINIADGVINAELRDCVVENVQGRVALMAGSTNLALVGSMFADNSVLENVQTTSATVLEDKGPVQTTSATVVVDNSVFKNKFCLFPCARDIALMSKASLTIKNSMFLMSGEGKTDSSASLYYTHSSSVTVDKRNFTVDVTPPSCKYNNLVSIDDLEPCMQCQAGTYGVSEVSYCTYCEKNQQSAEGATQCSACASGKFTMGKEGMAECTMCSGKMYGKNCEFECSGIFTANKSHTACVLSIEILVAIIAGVLVLCCILIFVVVFLKRQRAKAESEQYDLLANDAAFRGSLNSSKNKMPSSSSTRRQKKEEEKKT